MSEGNENTVIKTMKCKQCRSIVMDNYNGIIITGHGEKNNFYVNDHTEENCGVNDTVWYLNVDIVPKWVMDRINEFSWVKGRLNCPKCDARIGSFDFKKGAKCECLKHVLPGVSIIKSKVDI